MTTRSPRKSLRQIVDDVRIMHRHYPFLRTSSSASEITKQSDEKIKCACRRCSAMINKTDYTYPECPNCYLNLDGRCA